MATTEPQKWDATLGNTADVNAIPATTPSGSGRASFSGLFPPVTQLPLDQGGIAPERGDFNALFKYLGEYIYYAMQGGVYTYVTTYDRGQFCATWWIALPLHRAKRSGVRDQIPD